MSRQFRIVSALAACVAATASVTQAAVIWQNEGTISPWGHLLKEPGCSVTEVRSPTYRGDKAIRHFVTYPVAGADTSLHCEVARDPVAVTGDDRYYGWAYRLGNDWPSSYSRSSALSQLTGRGACWNQNDFIQLSQGLRLNDNTGGGADSCNPQGSNYTIGNPVSKNVWHRIVVHKLWKGDDSGRLEIWHDGVKMVDVPHIATGFGDNTAGYAWHVGLYAGMQSGDVTTRTVYTDQFRIATTYAEADPASWGGPVTTVEIPLAEAAVTASADDGNRAANTVDGALGTRWSASGDGQWIQYDLGSTRVVQFLKLAWFNGDTRRAVFDVLVSDDPSGPWTTVASGRQTSSTTLALETQEVTDAGGRYVRIVGHGNTANLWNSITETEIWGH